MIAKCLGNLKLIYSCLNNREYIVKIECMLPESIHSIFFLLVLVSD